MLEANGANLIGRTLRSRFFQYLNSLTILTVTSSKSSTTATTGLHPKDPQLRLQ